MTYARRIYEDRPTEEPCGCRWTYRLCAEGDYEGTIEPCDTHTQIAVRQYDRLIAAESRARKAEADLLVLALRLAGEDPSTFAPETADVMRRMKPKIAAAWEAA